MKKYLTIILITLLFCLTACSSSTPKNITELYDLFNSEEFSNVTISEINYLTGDMASNGLITKVDGSKYHIIESRDEEYYLEYGNTKLTQYTKEFGVWSDNKYDLDYIDMSMQTLFLSILPMEVEEFNEEDDIWVYESILDNIFNTQTTIYNVEFFKDRIEVRISESVINKQTEETSVRKIKDIIISDIDKTKVVLPVIE